MAAVVVYWCVMGAFELGGYCGRGGGGYIVWTVRGMVQDAAGRVNKQGELNKKPTQAPSKTVVGLLPNRPRDPTNTLGYKLNATCGSSARPLDYPVPNLVNNRYKNTSFYSIQQCIVCNIRIYNKFQHTPLIPPPDQRAHVFILHVYLYVNCNIDFIKWQHLNFFLQCIIIIIVVEKGCVKRWFCKFLENPTSVYTPRTNNVQSHSNLQQFEAIT